MRGCVLPVARRLESASPKQLAEVGTGEDHVASHPLPCTFYREERTAFLAPCTVYLLPCTMYLASCGVCLALYCVPCTGVLLRVPLSMCCVPFTVCPARVSATVHRILYREKVVFIYFFQTGNEYNERWFVFLDYVCMYICVCGRLEHLPCKQGRGRKSVGYLCYFAVNH